MIRIMNERQIPDSFITSVTTCLSLFFQVVFMSACFFKVYYKFEVIEYLHIIFSFCDI